METYVVDGAATPWMAFSRGIDSGTRVKVLLMDLDNGPEAVHSFQPSANVRPHFHLAAQFQLVLRGAIDFPRDHLKGIAVHYTDHSVAYGPFTTSPDFQMMVLHARPAGQFDISDRAARSKLNRTGREIGRSEAAVDWEPLPGVEGGRRKVLIAEPEGLGAEVVALPSGARYTPAAAPFGQYQVIVEGAARLGERELGPYGLRFARGDAAAGAITAGPDGARVVILTYDRDAAESYGGTFGERLAELGLRDAPSGV